MARAGLGPECGAQGSVPTLRRTTVGPLLSWLLGEADCRPSPLLVSPVT